MGVELEIACTACRCWAWLGSAKSIKWKGFQVGNEIVADWLVEHAHKHAAPGWLELWQSDGELPPWEIDPGTWKEDARSLGVTMADRVPGVTPGLDWEAVQWAKALWLMCARCGGEHRVAQIGSHAAQLVDGAAMAEWLLDHAAPACSLTIWLSAT